MDVNPENTQSNFKVKLREMIRLQGDWECSLSEIHYPNAVYNIPKCSFQYDPGSGEWQVVEITHGHYESTDSVVKALNNAMQKKDRLKIIFSFNKFTQKITIAIAPVCRLKLDNDLSMILGFNKGETLSYLHGDNKKIINDTRGVKPDFIEIIAPRVADLNRGWYNFFVYSDVVASSLVGDVQANLLRIVNTSGRRGEITNDIFLRPYYIPIAKNSFSQIHISLRRDTGEFLDFLKGKVILILHFRRKNLF